MKFKLYCVGMSGIAGLLILGIKYLNEYIYCGALIFAGISVVILHCYMMAIMHDEMEKKLKEGN